MKPDVYDEKAPHARTLVSARPHHHLVEPEAWENLPGQRIIGEYHQGSPASSHNGSKTQDGTDKDTKHPAHDTSGGPNLAKFLKTKVLDVTNVEMISSAIFRTFYGKGIRAPLKLKNVIDRDIAVDNNIVTVNTNNVSFIPPKLEIWRFIFAYKNKPLLEYGKGISGIKVYYGRAFVFGLTLWWVSWKKKWILRNPRAAKALQTYATTQIVGGKPD
jgi:hypothetical protein